MARTAVQKLPAVRRGRKGAATAAAPAPAKEPKKAKKAANLTVIEPEEDDVIDTSIVIDDFEALREAARAAMGDYASEVKDNIVEIIKAKRSGASQIHHVHPLSLHVVPGVNDREFANEEMRVRQIEFGNALLSQGIQKALDVFVQGDRLCIVGGETRIRSVLHLFVRGLIPDPKASRVGMIPIQLEKSGTNDFDRKLRVATSNDQRNLKPIEVAANIKALHDLGEIAGRPKMEIMQQIASAYGKTVTFVYGHLAMMELPSAVIGMLRREPIAVSIAMAAWKKTKNNEAETLKILNDALARMKESGKKKVMPKHAPELAVVADNTESGGDSGPIASSDTPDTGDTADTDTGDKGTTRQKEPRAPTENAISKAHDIILEVLRDARWILGDDGFVYLDTKPSAPAMQWSVEDYTFFTKNLGGFRVPELLKELELEDAAATE